jgi:hypothetical protein
MQLTIDTPNLYRGAFVEIGMVHQRDTNTVLQVWLESQQDDVALGRRHL